jgi:hypothetical protein
MKRIILLSVLQLLYFCFLFVASAQTNKASISKPSADTVFTYHSNGIIESKGLVSNQKKTGVWFFYDEEGNITLKETYVNDVQNGNFSSYYKNGKVFKKGILKNDLVQGLCLEYYESGALQFKNNYIEDELNGLSQEYYENGKLKKITNYINEQWDYIQDNHYPTIGWMDCFMVSYYMFCGKDYTENPYMTDTHHHQKGFDFDKFVEKQPEHIEIINNYKKYYWPENNDVLTFSTV